MLSPRRSRWQYAEVRHDERGQITVLILGFAVVLLLLVAVVTNSSKAYLTRRDLMALADAAALSAADGIGGDAYQRGLGRDTRIDPGTADQMVDSYVETSVDRAAYPDLRWMVEVDGARVVVHMTTAARMPLSFPGADGRIDVGADGSAVADLG